jgi:hypothetical protein
MSNSRDSNQEPACDRNITRTQMCAEQGNSTAETALSLITYLWKWGETQSFGTAASNRLILSALTVDGYRAPVK